MTTSWKTYPLEFKGGLITNLSPLQHGMQKPSSARILSNFEPSVEGGFRRIEGYAKFDDNLVPPYGEPKITTTVAAGGTSITLGNIFKAPTTGDTFTIASSAQSYTVNAVTTTDLTTKKRVALTFTRTGTVTTTLAAEATDKAAVTFTTGVGNILGVASFEDTAVVARGGDLFKSAGSASNWTRINVPVYGTVLVNAGSQTGTTLAVDGLTAAPQAGDTFTIADVAKVYTVTANATVSTGGSTLAIDPALASSPDDDAVITFLSTDRSAMLKHRFATFNFNGTETLVGVDSVNKPFTYDGSTFTVLNGAPSDVDSATHVVNFKNHLMFAKGSNLVYTALFTSDDFTAAAGAGTINVGDDITGIIVFREQLIIFSERKIQRLVGSSEADFQLQPITMDIGCVATDTIQEIGGDILFLGPDGIRSLSGTDKIGDFGLAVVSKEIQDEVVNFINRNTSFSSLVLREKSQYRILGFNASFTTESSQGLMATQLESGLAWGELRGIRAYVADSNYNGNSELAVFGETDGYVYQMEDGNSFNGTNIVATFATPFFPVSDPRVRKTFYKMHLYTDPQGSFNSNFSLKYDFSDPNIIQPDTITLSNTSVATAQSIYGNVQFAHGGLVNNASDYAASGNITSIAVDNLSSFSGLVAGDTFIISGHGTTSDGVFTHTTYTLSATPTISSSATTLAFTPQLVADLEDNTHFSFTKIAGVASSAYGGESLKSIFEEQTLGSGFTASLQFESEGTDAPYSFDAVTLEYSEHSHS